MLKVNQFHLHWIEISAVVFVAEKLVELEGAVVSRLPLVAAFVVLEASVVVASIRLPAETFVEQLVAVSVPPAALIALAVLTVVDEVALLAGAPVLAVLEATAE